MKYILKDGTAKETQQYIVMKTFSKTAKIDKQEIVDEFLNSVGDVAMFSVEFERLSLNQLQISSIANDPYLIEGDPVDDECLETFIKNTFTSIKATFDYIPAEI